MPRVGARVFDAAAPLQVAHQLQHAAEAEGDPVLEDAHRLRPEHFRVPARRLLEVTAGHRHVGDIADLDLGVVQQACGGLEFGGVEDGFHAGDDGAMVRKRTGQSSRADSI